MSVKKKLEGRRLHLRPLTEADAGPLFESISQSRDALKRRLRWLSEVEDVGAVSRFIEASLQDAGSERALTWGVFENRSQRIVGVMSLLDMEDKARNQGRFAGWIRTDKNDKGYASESGKLVVEYGFRRAGLHRISARLDPANRPFRKVLRKIGFKYEGCLRSDMRLNGRWIDQECWGLLKTEWKK